MPKGRADRPAPPSIERNCNIMLKTTVAAAAAAGFAVLGVAGSAMAQGVDAGDLSLANIDASDAAQWQICGQNVLAQPDDQDCDNADGADSGSGTGSDLSLVNGDGSDAAHWQICGQNVLAQLDGTCDNGDGSGTPSKGDDQGDF
jgi:hypothetical protein